MSSVIYNNIFWEITQGTTSTTICEEMELHAVMYSKFTKMLWKLSKPQEHQLDTNSTVQKVV